MPDSRKRNPFVVTVVVNMNRCEDTLNCLKSLSDNTYPNHAIIVVDVSNEDPATAIRSAFPVVETIHLDENRGYAGNNNAGIRMALDRGADWIFLLNDDTIAASDCLACLVTAGEGDSRIGVVGPMIYHFDEPNVIQSAGGRLGPGWRSEHVAQNRPDAGEWTAPRDVEWLSGCAIMLRRAAVEDVGPLDERYFCYWEETEWCLRARRSGWRSVHVPQAKVWHKGVQRNYSPRPWVTYYSTRNRLLTLSKHRAPVWVWLAAWSQMARTFTSWSVRPKWLSMREHRDALWLGMIDFLRRRWGEMSSHDKPRRASLKCEEAQP